MTRRCRPLLGTFVEIECNDPSAIDAGFAAIEAIHRLMSAHEPDSELSLINRTAHLGPVELSEPTAAVLARALLWAKASNGRFDVVRAGATALQRLALPLHHGQPVPDPEADWADISLDRHAVRLRRPACLDLGGIAKGFAVDRAVEAMIAGGATRGLVNAGGDLRAFGSEPWSVEVVDPMTRQPIVSIELRDAALATSAGLPSETGLEFGHLPDADTRWRAVTVTAASCCDADLLTKIVWSGSADTPRLLDQAGARAFAVSQDGSLLGIAEEAFA